MGYLQPLGTAAVTWRGEGWQHRCPSRIGRLLAVLSAAACAAEETDDGLGLVAPDTQQDYEVFVIGSGDAGSDTGSKDVTVVADTPATDAPSPPDATADLDVPTGDVDDVDVDDVAVEPDVPDVPTAGVRGRVVVSGAGIPDVAVRALGVPGTDITDGDGRFLLDAVPAGPAVLLAGPTPAGLAAALEIEVAATGVTEAGDLVLVAGGMVKGTVLAGGAASQAGALVELVGTGTETTSGASGAFQLGPIAPHCYTLKVSRPGYATVEKGVCVESAVATDVGVVVLPAGCKPSCDAMACGDDGCGASCGECPVDNECALGVCVAPAVCGNATCDPGETCADCADCVCPAPAVCLSGACCLPSCVDQECGDDGCGGSCGDCKLPLTCNELGLCALEGGACGDAICSAIKLENCKTCSEDCICPGASHCKLDTGTCCTPFCGANKCGDNGCGGSCGTCDPLTCVAGQCKLVCADIPVPGTLPRMPDLVPPPALESIPAGGLADDYLIDTTNNLKVGVRRSTGGVILGLGPVEDGAGLGPGNVLDAAPGRGVRVAVGDSYREFQGCAASAGCGGATPSCPATRAFSGWHPVLGPNECATLPTLETFTAENARIETGLLLLQFNPDWADPGCASSGCLDTAKSGLQSDLRYRQSVRMVAAGGLTAVELSMTLQNVGTQAHGALPAELPMVHGNHAGAHPMVQVVDANGTTIAINKPQPDGSMIATFESPGGFVAIQDATRSHGVGLLVESGFTTFRAVWRDTGLIGVASIPPVALAPSGAAGSSVSARVYLLHGDFATVSAAAAAIRKQLPPFGALQAPALDAVVTGTLSVSGWVADSDGIEGLTLLIDGKPVATSHLEAGIAAPDACAALAGGSQCSAVSFHGTASLKGLTPCAHRVSVLATDSLGNTAEIGAARFTAAKGTPCLDEVSCEDGSGCTLDQCDNLLGCVSGPKLNGDIEACNSVDDDCDGFTDEVPATGCTQYYADGDLDGEGTGAPECLCAPEYPYLASSAGDCNDGNNEQNSYSLEKCNGVDDDCDGQTDEGEAVGCAVYWQDGDNDGFGDGVGVCACASPGPEWDAPAGGDCNDKNPDSYPGALEICNAADDNCDDVVDGPSVCPPGTQPVFRFLWSSGADLDSAFSVNPTGFPGWTSEGSTFVVYTEGGPGRVGLYQSYCATCTDYRLHAAGQQLPEGFTGGSLLGYCATSSGGGTPRTLVRLINDAATDHTATASSSEATALLSKGYKADGILCYVP